VRDQPDPAAAAPLLVGPDGLPLAGLHILEDRQEGSRRTLLVRAADPDVLEALAAATPDWQRSIPSLEDVFVALVRKPLAY
jgi:hypothetical protein